MFRIAKDFTFAAGHWIVGHPGECARPHGHNYRVRVTLAARELDEIGMVLDFADLKRLVGEILAPFDHRMLNDVEPFDAVATTAERLAEHVFGEAAAKVHELAGERVAVERVEVWENETSMASYEGDR
ncbi:MAG: 6-carboxytetrahydropterin synthase QueD [Thermoanaerobaculia bacterium]